MEAGAPVLILYWQKILEHDIIRVFILDQNVPLPRRRESVTLTHALPVPV